ncbi:hypothetical protein BIY24_02100 [Halobacteriovorax marinus]|uniref:Uncharacterized protein n=1 Tax=Halobacteriovorax marinus (strain ATCC BAA-682 / DSM 15412 / SJ) TaxID=862908 RepID=E1X3Z9_HALMS|nr:hypothetical protein [Halobacteriovorax marinus]ATH06774.1 hypothetical protein BIY24_02100 [Halobacteriovorax marinus]CBW25339.1 hypothetical protein BMS_0422 [Halobacteriovorax marinus SJ]
MSGATSKGEKLFIEIDASELTQSQIRLIKSVNMMLQHVLVTDDEEEFFTGSAEFMRMCASIIKKAHFAEDLKGINEIPYAQQALEYSMDILQDHISSSSVVTYDN